MVFWGAVAASFAVLVVRPVLRRDWGIAAGGLFVFVLVVVVLLVLLSAATNAGV